jgi:hypothetical protein
VARLSKEIEQVITNGPPGITGYTAGYPKPQKIMANWLKLIPKEAEEVTVRVE